MAKLNIDGKLVDVQAWLRAAAARGIKSAANSVLAASIHAARECRSLPTYFCPHCAREALRSVDWRNPWL